jgi:hypothetical protein
VSDQEAINDATPKIYDLAKELVPEQNAEGGGTTHLYDQRGRETTTIDAMPSP